MAGRGTAAANAPKKAPADPPVARRRVFAIVAMVLGALVFLSLAGWGIWSFLNRTEEPAVDRTQYEALSAKLTAIHDAVTPIALSFTSQGATTPIDVAAYRARIDKARSVVSSVNDIDVTAPDALEIRDSIITGGEEVLDGMDDALTALTHDSTSQADAAAGSVEEGLTILDDARTRLNSILGISSTT